jgi:hypothetical protein
MNPQLRHAPSVGSWRRTGLSAAWAAGTIGQGESIELQAMLINTTQRIRKRTHGIVTRTSHSATLKISNDADTDCGPWRKRFLRQQ